MGGCLWIWFGFSFTSLTQHCGRRCHAKPPWTKSAFLLWNTIFESRETSANRLDSVGKGPILPVKTVFTVGESSPSLWKENTNQLFCVSWIVQMLGFRAQHRVQDLIPSRVDLVPWHSSYPHSTLPLLPRTAHCPAVWSEWQWSSYRRWISQPWREVWNGSEREVDTSLQVWLPHLQLCHWPTTLWLCHCPVATYPLSSCQHWAWLTWTQCWWSLFAKCCKCALWHI